MASVETKPKKKYLLKRVVADSPYKCSQCETCFSSKRNLANHIEAVHEGKKPFVCANCNAKYSQKHSLILHIARKHGVKCSMCDEKFSTIQELKQHFSSVHDGNEVHEETETTQVVFGDENETTEMVFCDENDTTEVVLNDETVTTEQVVIHDHDTETMQVVVTTLDGTIQ